MSEDIQLNGQRKIVFVLGNGFDLDLGLKTSYKDFWESESCPKDYPAPLIHHLNECWPDNRGAVRWYDLENELFNYYQKYLELRSTIDVLTPSEIKFVEAFDPIKMAFGINASQDVEAFQSLYNKGYLIEVAPINGLRYRMPYQKDMLESFVWRDRKAFQLIKKGLCEYLKTIENQACNGKSIAKKVLAAAGFDVENKDKVIIYTFNYTSIRPSSWTLPKDSVYYVHGNCQSDSIILGAGDRLNMDQDYDFLQKSFDTNYAPPALVKDLLEADNVIIFGHSFGENDRQYFKPFFKHQADYSMARRKDITIFTRNEDSEIQIKRALQEMTEGALSALFGLNDFRIIRTATPQKEYEKLESFLLNNHFTQEQADFSLRDLIENE